MTRKYIQGEDTLPLQTAEDPGRRPRHVEPRAHHRDVPDQSAACPLVSGNTVTTITVQYSTVQW